MLVGLRERFAPYSVKVTRASLSACFAAAVNLGLVSRNPVKSTTPIRLDRGRKDVWSPEQVRALLTVTQDDEQWGVVFRLLAETWMRVGEACGLRWGDIDFAAGTVRVGRTMRLESDGWIVGDDPKTRAGVRTIPVSPVLVDMLRQLKDRQRFRSMLDTVLDTNPDRVRDRLYRICRDQGWERAGPHMLRHAGATMAAAAGMEPRVMQERLGHSHISMTLSRYVHPNQEAHRQAADAVARLLG